MDSNNKKSLISKIVAKGVITPYEAIYLQHLNNEYVKSKFEYIDPTGNFYLDSEKIEELVSPYLLNQLLSFSSRYDCNLYDLYRCIACELVCFEDAANEIGYKGIALLNEMRYFRDENFMKVLESLELKKQYVPTNLFKYETYSRVNQKHVTFEDLLGNFGLTFKELIMDIDIVLTCNFYLQNMFDIDNFKCLKCLKMWLAGDRIDENVLDEDNITIPIFDIVQKTCEDSIDQILDYNHPKYVEMIKEKARAFNIETPAGFEERSLEFIKDLLSKITANPNPQIAA